MATGPQPDLDDVARGARWLWWLTLSAGLLSLMVGVIVILRPGTSLSTLAVITGIFLVADGGIAVARAAMIATENRTLLALLGAVSVIAGVMLVRHPIRGIVAVALLIGLWLIVVGIVRFVRALDDPERGVLSLAVAAVEVIAGIVIVSSPDIGVATLALMVGLSFLLRGLVLCALAWAARAVFRAAGAPAPGRVGAPA